MTPAKAIYEALLAVVVDELHTSGLNAVVTGGVFNRRMIRPPSPGAITEAFDASGRMKPSITVIDRGEEEDPSGPQDKTLRPFMGFPQVWFYARAIDSGHTAIEAMTTAVLDLFQTELVSVSGLNGSSVGVRVIGRNGVDDEPEMAGVIFDMYRLQVDGLWVS